MSYHHGYLYLRGPDGQDIEVINQARTAAYLQNPALAIDGVSICDVLDFGGCEAYSFQGACDDEASMDFITGSTSYASVPDTAALDITAFTITMRVRALDWTPSSTQTLISKWDAGTQQTFHLDLSTAGALVLNWSTTGANTNPATSSQNLSSLPNATWRWIKVQFEPNAPGVGRRVSFWTSVDGLYWDDLGTPQTGTASSLFSSSAPLRLGARDNGTTQRFGGKIKDVILHNQNGVDVFRIEANDIPFGAPLQPGPPSYRSASGHTVTVTGAWNLLDADAEVPAQVRWEPLIFTTPDGDDQAPWYSSAYPESRDALGFYIEEWTGLDGEHVRRPSTPLATGGSQMGRVHGTGRVMKLNVICFARSEEGMEYLFRWLERVLYQICGNCETDAVLFRRTCPNRDNLWEGLTELRNVGLTEGLRWEADVVQRGRCFIRRLSFSMTAGDPCMYTHEGVDTETWVEESLIATLPTSASHDRYPCRPRCGEEGYYETLISTLDVSSVGAAAPMVELMGAYGNGAGVGTLATHVMAIYDPLNVGTSDICGLQILGEIWVRPMDPNEHVLWDVLGRRILYKGQGIGDWAPGEHMVYPNTPGIPRFFAMPCGRVHFVIGLADLCLAEHPELGFVGYVNLEGQDGTFMPNVRVSWGSRLGCP